MRSGLSRRTLIGGGLVMAGGGAIAALRPRGASGSDPVSPPPGLPLPLVGVNLASAEFGSNVPGRHGYDYVYPSAADVDYFAQLGFTCLRLPFLWERLQPTLDGAFDTAERERLEQLVGAVTSRGMTAIIDPHNYARRRLAADRWSKEHMIGSAAVPTASFMDFWRRLAGLFKANPRVVLGLMNEPYDMPAAHWLEIANRTISAIRSVAARNLILVPGTAWSGAHSWLSSGNTILERISDPAANFAIEVHQYLDGNSSGTSPDAVSGTCGSERLQAFQDWARQHRLKAFLGEFGAANNPTSLNALADICQEMSANPDVWLGWAAWSAGPFWPADYMFNLGPAPDRSLRPQTRILAGHAKPDSHSYWVKPGAVIDFDLARERWHGSAPDASFELTAPRVRRSGQPGLLRVRGPLLTALQGPAFTLLVETANLASPAESTDIVTSKGGALLRRTGDGALGTSWGGSWRIGARPLAEWRGRQRCAFSLSRPLGRIAIAATGCGSLARHSAMVDIDNIVITAGLAGGRVVRVTAFPEFLDAAALEALVA